MQEREYARRLRKNYSDAENRMWYFLRNRRLNGHKFIRQFVISPYIVDFICREKSLIVELDGSQHADAEQYDESRTNFLTKKGYKVIRFWNSEIFKNITNVLENILIALEEDENAIQNYKSDPWS